MSILQRVSLTVGRNQIVDEIVITFTHTTVVDWMIPRIAPTGKKVEAIVVVIAGVKDKKYLMSISTGIKRVYSFKLV